jgi:hypothetical protein
LTPFTFPPTTTNPAGLAGQAAVAFATTRAGVEVAGEFGDKQFLVRIEELPGERPVYDRVH